MDAGKVNFASCCSITLSEEKMQKVCCLICISDLSLVYTVLRTESVFKTKSICPKKKDRVNETHKNKEKKESPIS